MFFPKPGKAPNDLEGSSPKKGSFWDGPMLANRHSRCILAAIDFILECFDIQKISFILGQFLNASIMWETAETQCHKPTIWGWFESPI